MSRSCKRCVADLATNLIAQSQATGRSLSRSDKYVDLLKAEYDEDQPEHEPVSEAKFFGLRNIILKSIKRKVKLATNYLFKSFTARERAVVRHMPVSVLVAL